MKEARNHGNAKRGTTNTFFSRSPIRDATILCCELMLTILLGAPVIAGTAVLTRSYDDARTGANTSETELTAAKVSQGLKILFSLKVTDDPRIEAQPLYVPGITMSDGKQHNVIYVFSMANTVWAFDANSGAAIWNKPVSLGTPYKPKVISKFGEHRRTEIDLYGINIRWGILSTPVIDLETRTMYVANWVLKNGKPALRLHAIRLSDGSELNGSPIPIAASVTATPGHGVTLNQGQKSRAALLLVPLTGQTVPPAHKMLYVGFTGGEVPGDPHGWVVAFDTATFKQTAAWLSTPNSFGGGIWQGAQGPSADDAGNVYLMTGNGGFTVDHDGKITDFVGSTDFAEAFVKLTYSASASGNGTLTLADWFIPFKDSHRAADYRDQDLGSGAPVVPPTTDLLLGARKDDVLYVMNRNNLGKVVADFSKLKSPPIFFTFFPGFNVSPTGNLDFQPVPGFKTHHLHASPVFWDGPDRGPMLFDWGENECLRAWTINTISGQVAFVAKSTEIASAALANPQHPGLGGMTGGMISLSANGAQKNTGVVWATAPIDGNANTDVVEGIVRAYDAATLDTRQNADNTPRLKLLWTSKDIPHNTFNFSKFCPPFVADGKLFVTTYSGRVDMYGPK